MKTKSLAIPARQDYERQVLAGVQGALGERLSEWLAAGIALPDPDALATLIASRLPDAPASSGYASLIGPCYSSAGIRRVLHIPTKQALDDRRQRGTILAAQTSEGVWVYPAFQVDADRAQVREHVQPLLKELKGAPRWGTALWFVTPQPLLEQRTPLQASKIPSLREQARGLAAEYAMAHAS